MSCGERINWRCHSSEDQADVSGLHGHLKPCDACAVAKGHVYVYGHSAVRCMFMFMASVTTKGHVDAPCLDCHLKSC